MKKILPPLLTVLLVACGGQEPVVERAVAPAAPERVTVPTPNATPLAVGGSLERVTLPGAALSDPGIDALIESAAIEPQSIVRLAKLQEAVSIVSEQYVYIPLFRPSNLALVRDGVAAGTQALPMLRPQDLRPAD